MNQRHVIDVPGWEHDVVQGEHIVSGDLPKKLILPKGSRPATVTESTLDSHVNLRSSTQLFSIGLEHGRSYEVASGNWHRSMGRLALWSDEFNNTYSSFSLKGNNMTNQAIFESATAPSGYMAFGLLESDALLRVIRSSRLLREAGISTEWINSVFEPQLLVYGDDLVTQEEYKKRLIKGVYKDKGMQEASEVAAAIDPLKFFITARSMEINDRPNDFFRDSFKTGMRRLRHVFRIYNETHKEDEGFNPLNHESLEDRNRYFLEILPALLGTNMARLHNLGLTHTFPVIGNVNAMGGLVDLDSIVGASLDMGDNVASRDKKFEDLETLVRPEDRSHDFEGLFRQLRNIGLAGDFSEDSKAMEVYKFAEKLIDSYQEAAFDEADSFGGDNIQDEAVLNYMRTFSWNTLARIAKEQPDTFDYLVGEVAKVVNEEWNDNNFLSELAEHNISSYLFDIYSSEKGFDISREELDYQLRDLLLKHMHPNIINIPVNRVPALVNSVIEDTEVKLLLDQVVDEELAQKKILEEIIGQYIAIRDSEIETTEEEIEIKGKKLSSFKDKLVIESMRALGKFSRILDMDQFSEPLLKKFHNLMRGENESIVSFVNWNRVDAYGGLDLKDFLQKAIGTDGEVDIIVDDRSIEMNTQESRHRGEKQEVIFNAAGGLEGIRGLVSDVGPIILGASMAYFNNGGQSEPIAINYDDSDPEYMAYILGPNDKYGKPTIVVRHKDPSKARKILQEVIKVAGMDSLTTIKL